MALVFGSRDGLDYGSEQSGWREAWPVRLPAIFLWGFGRVSCLGKS